MSAERQAWLAKACPGDELRREVEGRAAAPERTGGRLGQPADLGARPRHPSAERPTEALPSGPYGAVDPPAAGPYRLLRQVGRGGMGAVYLAHDPRLDRHVALKFLLEPLPLQASRPAKRFLAEARAASALDHPNICTIHDVGETAEGQLYIAMAYYRGGTVAERIARAPIGVDEAVEIALQVAEGLARAHEAGIIHRDVKPANLMLTDRLDGARDRARPDRVKILDFGIARLEGGPPTRTSATPGTLAYMSPEQFDGAVADPRSDLWSLGVVLYEMLTGELPFRGGRGPLMRAILFEQPRPLRSLRPEVPPSLERVVEKALSKDPARRHADAGELARELEGVRREIGSARAQTPGVSRPEPYLRRFRRSRRLAAAAVLGLAVVGGAWQAPRAQQADVPAALTSSRSSVAVLYFENLSGDPDLDWLRRGLTDMLVTDLSQSRELRVLGTDSLDQILTDLGRGDERVTSADLVREVAERGPAGTVILGSFARLGGTLRVSVKLRQAASGAITTSKKIDARSEAELFARVDELSRDIRLEFEPPSQPER